MTTPLGRNGLIGLAVGATAGCGLIAFIIYKEIVRRRSQRLVLEARPASRLFDGVDKAVLLQDAMDAQEVEAQQQALAAVEAVVQGLSPEQQLEFRNQLDDVLTCVASLRSEVAELRGGLQDIAQQIIQDVNYVGPTKDEGGESPKATPGSHPIDVGVSSAGISRAAKKGVEDSQRVRRRRHFIHRERNDSTGSSSIYFTASQGVASTYETTSEGGYSTAYAESDYTDRDTDKEEGEQEPEQESEEEEERSCATVLTIRQEDSQEEEVEEEDEEEEEDKGRLQLVTEVPSGELALLLAQSDILHTGDASLKAEGFRLLLDNRAEYGDSREFLWRLARAYRDMYESTEDKQEKKTYAQQGREEAELALKKNGLNAECHKWFAVLTELTSQHDSMHSKLKSSHILKEHLDRALALRDDDPMCFYLLGRWCYEVATLDWLEQKAAAALYQSPPTSTLHDALENFLKAEELSPGFSKTVRLYIAQCHRKLGNISEATNWTELALKMPTNSNYDETTKLEAQLRVLTDRKT
ncbi:regulator of microtubule dynamics protein 3 isoform X1 [Perca flavescens]|uniref:regulator of microtubule dynamics protein 3 isoform X1 n=1 Tax=Perca flavescens TaxID=8167 RepID=UPI00106EDA91|nr:regulator of microtubule dynamics protein 3 isoform X1 [Perca flavescens]